MVDFSTPVGGDPAMQTAAQNVAQNINGLRQTWLNLAGVVTSQTVAADTVIITGAGRIVSISVVDKGTAPGTIYDYNSTTSPPDENALYTIDDSATGVFPLGLNFTTGIVVVIGTDQKVNVTYTLM